MEMMLFERLDNLTIIKRAREQGDVQIAKGGFVWEILSRTFSQYVKPANDITN